MDEYYLFGFLPLLRPLAMIPLAPRMFYPAPVYYWLIVIGRTPHLVTGA